MVIFMRDQRKKHHSLLILLFVLCLVYGCLIQKDPFRPIITGNIKQCVTPIREVSISVAPAGISTMSNGALFGAADGDVYLFNNKGELLWTKEGMASRYALLMDEGKALLVSRYNKKESWKSGIAKVDAEGNILWEKQTGLIGEDGLAVTPDGSFIAVGATDEEKMGHLMLFDGDGTKLWNHQIDGRIETVAVSKTGYVVAGPRDMHVYVYDHDGELTYKHYAGNYYDSQDLVISPDESFFLFGSEHKYVNCCTLLGELLWQREVGPLCCIKISTDGEFIAIGTSNSKLFLFNRNGCELWNKKVTEDSFVNRIAISAHGDYIVVKAEEILPPISSFKVYSKEGDLLWLYEDEHPFKAIAMSGDGHYIAAGTIQMLLFFDNFAAIEEYKSSECAQSHKDEQFKVCIC